MILRTSLLIFSIIFTFEVYAQTFAIEFTQGGQAIKVENGAVHLRKEPFVIHTTLNKLDGVFVNCAFDSVVYNGAMQRNLPDFQSVGWKVSVETEFNKDQELLIQDQESYCYWFYDPKAYDWHRFDSVMVRKGNSIIGTKTIRQFYVIENKQTISIRDIQQAPLYLSFFSVSGSFNKENAQLEQVQCFRLYFED
jgi:hypothetical protein